MEMEPALLVIQAPLITEIESAVHVRYPVKSDGWPSELWFEINGLSISEIDRTLNAALLALIMPAMKQGRKILLEGDVSCRLLFSCTHEVQSILSQVLGLPRVKIDVSQNGSLIKKSNEGVSATGFSGGVDSYATLTDYYFSPDVPPEGRLSLMVFNNVGANGRADEVTLYQTRRSQAESAAERIGLPLVVVNSNMDDFYSQDPELFFARTHTLRNSAVAHLISNKVSIYRYASAYPFSDCKVQANNIIGHSDPLLLPFLGSEWLDIQANGSQYRRTEKLALIAENPIVQENLHVCVDHFSDGNCSKCQKCMRTMLTLDLMGKLHLFDDVFDRELYSKEKSSYLSQALSRRDSFSRDIQELFKRTNARIKVWRKIRVGSQRAMHSVKQIAKTVRSELS